MLDPRRKPLQLILVEAKVEYPDRDLSAVGPNRQDRVAEERKVTAVRPADDQQPSGRTGLRRDAQGTRR